ncbi:serpentine type 7TM GPCR chemoreceptor srt domain-containing protein [Ditylenchus destructor]|nr:serpentine type 7TM GPCR chemoreceptor srt domain-containing protein [Ditylenchus destructor]
MEASNAAENIAVGISIIIYTWSILALNVTVMKAIHENSEMYRLNSYKLMLCLAYSDSIQMIIHSITGIFTIFQVTIYPLNKILGSIACYKFYAVVNLILAINRFVTVASPHTESWMFSKQRMKASQN